MKHRSIFSNKKAAGDIESYFVIIKLILAISVISAMSAYVYSVASDTFFQKLYFSRDIAFTASTIYSAPGDIYHEYVRKSLNKFEVDFNEQKVKLREEDAKKKGLSFDYYYPSNLDYIFKTNKIKESNKIVLQKSPGLFEINNELNKKLKTLKCPKINTADEGWKQKFFLIDPAYSDNEEKNIIAGSIGFSLYSKFENKENTRDNIRGDINKQTRKEPKEIKELMEKSEVILSIDMGDYSDNNDIKIYVSPAGNEELTKKREKMGCLILNELVSDSELNNIFTGGKVIKANLQHIKKEYGKILDNDKISIVLEIGNIQSERISELQNVGIITKIAKQIYNGIEGYYD